MSEVFGTVFKAKDKLKRKLRDQQPADDKDDEHDGPAGSYGAPDSNHMEGSSRGIERLNPHRPSSAEVVPPPQHQRSSQGGNLTQWGAQPYYQPNQYQHPPTNQGSSYPHPTTSNPQYSHSNSLPYGLPVNPSSLPPSSTAYLPSINSSTPPPPATPQQYGNQGWGYSPPSAFPQTQAPPQSALTPPAPAYTPQNPNHPYPPPSSYSGHTSNHHQQYPQSASNPQSQPPSSYYPTTPPQASTPSTYNPSNSNPVPPPSTPSLQSSASYGSPNSASTPPGQQTQNQYQYGTLAGHPPPQPGVWRTQTAPPSFQGGTSGGGGSYPSTGPY